MVKFLTKGASPSTITKRKRMGDMVITHKKYKGFDIARHRRVGERTAHYVADNPHFPGWKFYDKTSYGIQGQVDRFLKGRKNRNQFMRFLEGKKPYK